MIPFKNVVEEVLVLRYSLFNILDIQNQVLQINKKLLVCLIVPEILS